MTSEDSIVVCFSTDNDATALVKIRARGNQKGPPDGVEMIQNNLVMVGLTIAMHLFFSRGSNPQEQQI